mmetsp:Transcript_19997/g.52207  ORF Transcript_19997/g.52207 Transcript_19997/m.52207 type:complete len:212 (+) Transcript_19997:616-1251(+)
MVRASSYASMAAAALSAPSRSPPCSSAACAGCRSCTDSSCACQQQRAAAWLCAAPWYTSAASIREPMTSSSQREPGPRPSGDGSRSLSLSMVCRSSAAAISPPMLKCAYTSSSVLRSDGLRDCSVARMASRRVRPSGAASQLLPACRCSSSSSCSAATRWRSAAVRMSGQEPSPSTSRTSAFHSPSCAQVPMRPSAISRKMSCPSMQAPRW